MKGDKKSYHWVKIHIWSRRCFPLCKSIIFYPVVPQSGVIFPQEHSEISGEAFSGVTNVEVRDESSIGMGR